MEAFYLILEGLSSFFDGAGTATGMISDLWFFAQYWTDFIGWVVDFFQRVAEFFA